MTIRSPIITGLCVALLGCGSGLLAEAHASPPSKPASVRKQDAKPPAAAKLSGNGKIKFYSLVFDESREYAYTEATADLMQRILDAAKLKDAKEQVAALEALASEPKNGDVALFYLERLFSAYERTENLDKMEEVAKKLLADHPGSKEVLASLVTEMYGQKTAAERALPYAEQLVAATREFKLKPRPANAPANWEEVAGEARQRAGWNRERSYHVGILGWMQYQVGKYNEAEISLRESVALGPFSLNLNKLGLTLAKLGKDDEAVQLLVKSVVMDESLRKESDAELKALAARNPKTDLKALEARVEKEVAAEEQAKLLKDLVNKPSEEFELAALSGKQYKLSALRGKVVMLNFWASW